MVGYARLLAIPVFCVLAFSSGDGHDPWAWGLFWPIAAGDYLDGFLARATAIQPNRRAARPGRRPPDHPQRRRGSAGASSCCRRWAFAVLAVREVVTLVLGQIALRRGPGARDQLVRPDRCVPDNGAIFWAMVVESVVWDVMLIVGVALAVAATIAYARSGMRALAEDRA